MRAVVAVVLGLFLLIASPPEPAEAQELVGELRRLVSESGLSEEVGVAVVDAHTGRAIFQHHAERPMNPASNQKLVTAFAALRALGPDFTMRTAVYGALEGDAVRGGLALRGYGDPNLTRGDLMALAADVADQGVRRVDRIIVDASYFDDQILPPAFGQQPNEVAAFRAPVSAIAVDRNAYVLRVLPGAEVGAPAHVRLLGAGYFELNNRITTAEPGRLNIIADQRGDGPRMTLRVSGSIPVDVRGCPTGAASRTPSPGSATSSRRRSARKGSAWETGSAWATRRAGPPCSRRPRATRWRR